MKTKISTLPGGLRVATCEMPYAETISVGVWAGVGGRHEPARLNGISHFIEHMLFKGTKRRSAKKIMEEIEGVGGDINAYTSEERTCYYGAAAAEFFPRLSAVLCDLYCEPKLAPVDIERERGVIAEEILMYRDEPSSHVQELMNQNFWPSHALGRPITGTMETVGSMGREDFLRYRKTHYHARSTVFTAAGRIHHDEVLARAEKLLSQLPGGRSPRSKPAPQVPCGPRVAVEKRDTQQTQVAIGMPGTSHHDPSRFPLHLLHILLGGNGSSRLFQQLRERRGLCYSVSTHPGPFDDTGMFNISLGLDAKNLEKSLCLILAEIQRIKKIPPRPAELRRAKEYAIGISRMSLERTSSQNARAGNSVLIYGEILEPKDVHARLRAVTAEEVSQAARQFLDPLKATVAIVGPDPQPSKVKSIFS